MTTVLVEHADGAARWALTRALQRSGFTVTSCPGPDELPGHRCTLLADGACDLVAGADVVVNGFEGAMGDEIAGAVQHSRPRLPMITVGPRIHPGALGTHVTASAVARHVAAVT